MADGGVRGEHRVEFETDPASARIAVERPKAGKKPLAETVAGLEARGYGPILEIERDVEDWDIEAVQEGGTVESTADRDTGAIRSEGEGEPEREARESEQR